jgi:hypothetical protein
MTRRARDQLDGASALDDAKAREETAEADMEAAAEVDVMHVGTEVADGQDDGARDSRDGDQGTAARVFSRGEVVRSAETATRETTTAAKDASDVIPAWAMVRRDGPIPDIRPPQVTTRVTAEQADDAAEDETRTNRWLRTRRWSERR